MPVFSILIYFQLMKNTLFASLVDLIAQIAKISYI